MISFYMSQMSKTYQTLSPFRMMMRMQAMLSESGEMILQFSMIELRILLGLSSASSLEYLSAMKSVYLG